MTDTSSPAGMTSESAPEPAGVRVSWSQAYRAGILADLEKQPRVPPSDFDEAATAAWLAGYDR